MVDVPDELIDDILIRLPVKSLLKFKKDYSYEFAKRHLKQSTSRSSENLFLYLDAKCKGIVFQSLDVRQIIEFPNGLPKECYHIAGSVNGLICVAPWTGTGCFIWNPCISECKRIFPTEYFPDCWLCGFGYDSYSDDYKIVGSSKSHFGVFSVKNNSWRVFEHKVSDTIYRTKATFFREALHWCVGPKIVAFDLVKEDFFYIELPELVPDAMFSYIHIKECSKTRLRSYFPSECSKTRLGSYFPSERRCEKQLFDYRGSLCFFYLRFFCVMKEYGNVESWGKYLRPEEAIKLPVEIQNVFHEKREVFVYTESLISPNYISMPK